MPDSRLKRSAVSAGRFSKKTTFVQYLYATCRAYFADEESSGRQYS